MNQCKYKLINKNDYKDLEIDRQITSWKRDILLSPALLVKILGKPEIGDKYKVSGIYTFRFDSDSIITLYDYKWTSLYNKDAISPESFWKGNYPIPFSIGANDRVVDKKLKAFIRDLEVNLEKRSYIFGV